MEEEIDLRPYINSLRRRGYLIVSVAVSLGILAYIVGMFSPSTYEATALILIEPNDIIQFDERFLDPVTNQPLKIFSELATSDEVLQLTLTQIPTDQIRNVEQLRRNLSTSVVADNSIIRLTASYDDPELVAQIADTWATISTQKANNIFYDSDGNQVQFYESQLMEANTKLTTAENALTTFQSTNRELIISNTLQVYSQKQINYLTIQANLSQLHQDTQSLLTSLTSFSNNANLTFGDQFAALLLQIRIYNPGIEIPVILQVDDSNIFTAENKAQQIALLENWLDILESQNTYISQELTQIEPTILDLQQQLQTTNTEYERLSREVTVAQETYTALALKVEEEKIASQNEGKGINIVSKPRVPVDPVQSSKLRNAIIASVAGLVFATSFVIFHEWWQIYNKP